MAYLTLQEQKAHMGVTETADDAFIQQLIDKAPALIEAPAPIGIGRKFAASTSTSRTFDAKTDVEGRRLWLDEDLCGITTITNGDGDTITSSQYVTQPRNDAPYWCIELRSDADVAWEYASGTGNHENAITVTGYWAYSTAPDALVKLATAELVSWVYRRVRHGTTDQDRPIISGDGTVFMPSVLPQFIKDMLASRAKAGV